MSSSLNGGEYVIERVEAQRSATLIQAAALIGSVVCIALAARLQQPINQQRRELQLVMQSDIYKDLPPEYAWVSAAGTSFRGLAVDLFWMRADKLKEEGKYYELHQLAKWICTLQPRFAAVWSFQAWNMSYNISVATHTSAERWQWVYNGIRLLRDEGIPNNERVVPLYHQMAWTWFHKVGERMDDYHHFYKRMWAATMETLLGAPPAGLSDAATIDWFRPVAQAPRTLDELIEARPAVADLVEDLDDLGVDVEAGTNNQRVYHPLEGTFFQPYTAYLYERSLAALRVKPPEKDQREKKLADFLDRAPEEDFNALLAYLRAKVLREQYKMDPKYMLDLTGRLSTAEPIPIDWRTPWSQTLYWAAYGLDKGEQARNVKEFDRMNTDRIYLFSLKTMAKVGRYLFRINLEDPMDSFLNMGPDFRYIEAMHNKYVEIGRRHREKDDKSGPAGSALRSGHVNSLHSAIVGLYLAGREEEARKYLDYLAANYRKLYRPDQAQDQYLQDVSLFVQSQLKEMAETWSEASSLIYSILAQGYLGLAGGRGDEHAAAVRNAKLVYDFYHQGRTDDPQGRRELAEFPEIRGAALFYFVTAAEQDVLVRSIAWTAEQDEVKHYCYDDAIGHLRAECEAAGLDVNKAFPEPAGMREWRQAHPRSVQPEDKAEEEEGEEATE